MDQDARHEQSAEFGLSPNQLPFVSEMEKARLRQHFKGQQAKISSIVREGILTIALRELPELVPSDLRLGLFWPLAHEPDLLPLTTLFSEQTALPAVRKDIGLIYLPWRPQHPLGKDDCGIPTPLEGFPLAPEAMALLLVPALAVTPDGLRLGSGGGWYDRLRADPRWKAVPALAVLPAACVVRSLPREAWDVPFSGWLDENGLHWVKEQPGSIAEV